MILCYTKIVSSIVKLLFHCIVTVARIVAIINHTFSQTWGWLVGIYKLRLRLLTLIISCNKKPQLTIDEKEGSKLHCINTDCHDGGNMKPQ